MLEVEGGLNRDSLKARGSHSDALVDDVLAYRASAFYDRQQTATSRTSTAAGRWHERNRWGGRAVPLQAAG